ncbi:MAG TPA: ribosome recycling factor [Patescibacteria group bacterium]|nr:ribosome recycling factor [Patescibacteria group bacterium]
MYDFTQFKNSTQKLLLIFEEDISLVRSSRAKPSMVENVMVDAYGTKMRLVELASVTAPDASSLVIKPWDASVLGAIEKGIQASDLHINPVVDGDLVRIAIPPLTGERRQELAKLVAQKLHAHEEMLRDIRTKIKKQVEAQKGQAGVSEDDIKRENETLQKLTDEAGAKLIEIAKKKQTELETI